MNRPCRERSARGQSVFNQVANANLQFLEDGALNAYGLGGSLMLVVIGRVASVRMRRGTDRIRKRPRLLQGQRVDVFGSPDRICEFPA